MARSPRSTSPRQAAEVLADGNLVALPTETVYGLGGLASSKRAVERIFTTKGRPANHPLIVHVAEPADLCAWSSNTPQTAVDLAEAFWPGPLTLVVDRGPEVLDVVTGGQPSVALRAPSHPLFLEVLTQLRSLGFEHPGIAAPSANRFGQVSPTTAEHVQAELGSFLGSQDLILDGGPSSIGLESTIVICGPEAVSVARSGAITSDQLSAVVSVVADSAAPDLPRSANAPPSAPTALNADNQVRVPGSLASHYSPRANVTIAEPTELPRLLQTIARGIADVEQSYGFLGLDADLPTLPTSYVVLQAARDESDLARGLYAALRRADDLHLDQVIAILPPGVGLGIAIRDRLTRAAAD